MLPKLYVTKFEMSLKLKCYPAWNVLSCFSFGQPLCVAFKPFLLKLLIYVEIDPPYGVFCFLLSSIQYFSWHYIAKRKTYARWLWGKHSPGHRFCVSLMWCSFNTFFSSLKPTVQPLPLLPCGLGPGHRFLPTFCHLFLPSWAQHHLCMELYT